MTRRNFSISSGAVAAALAAVLVAGPTPATAQDAGDTAGRRSKLIEDQKELDKLKAEYTAQRKQLAEMKKKIDLKQKELDLEKKQLKVLDKQAKGN